MALIRCSECGHEVSSKAESCPKCGNPIAVATEAAAAGSQIRTVQETSKKFKLQTLISVAMVIVGFIWFFAAAGPGEEPSLLSTAIPGLMIVAGLAWYLVNRFRIWWHHK